MLPLPQQRHLCRRWIAPRQQPTIRFHLRLISTLLLCKSLADVPPVRLLREELGLLQQPGSYVGEVVKVMGSKRVLVKVHPEGKYGTVAWIAPPP